MSATHHGILLHVIFSTKFRRDYLDASWQDELYAFIGGVVKDHKAILLKSGGIENHIHLLIRFHPEFPISKTIQLLKANSSRWINEQRKINGRFEWQRGYGAFSVSSSNSEAVKTYIANQEQHHAKLTFEDEYLAILCKHQIEFDPKYVFDTELSG